MSRFWKVLKFCARIELEDQRMFADPGSNSKGYRVILTLSSLKVNNVAVAFCFDLLRRARRCYRKQGLCGGNTVEVAKSLVAGQRHCGHAKRNDD